MDVGMMALLSKTVSLMENLGFMWLVHTGFELNLWERLLEEKPKAEIMTQSSEWDETLLDHWLEQARVQELVAVKNGRFQLSKMGKAVYRYRDYGLEAMYKEFVLHWGPCFGKLPDLMKRTIPRGPMESEMENELISKASKASEPFVWPLLRKKCEKDGWSNVLDVGCGEAAFLQRLAAEFPELRGVGLEINPEVAKRADAQMDSYQGRIRIEPADVLEFHESPGTYDCCLLNNNIYYFDREKRVELLNSLYELLRPGGRIGILTALRGVTPSLQIIKTHIPQNLMSFFLACHQNFEGLPFEHEMTDLLEQTGFMEIEAIPLPFKVSHYFFARKPSEFNGE
ncbi:methylase involved in ubiquinone/menaquinone biosynthesis [Desulfosporosinus orientis DSM 765]|uniref:Methylase involved in ubiquinone/menaquinone biosynthesis n=1 Tax=Desulfosporosinus orientis (strain ATCC 19365 / DSM 765 / NCIMB 8382 / VKM B-1628 / Singapore I) TaxID=768706 RepID=G7WFW1_DESOD|nr:class I SAM-dependent methyltransferase [Desulfosporosinus orientis]AET69476.1 methylase involved in ubiquinone/menaquinone biosynthesis [Desulfosporosinus orientis DSM 765]